MVQRVVEVRPAGVGGFVSIATFLPVRRWRDVVAFLRLAGKVEQQLRKPDGLVRYGAAWLEPVIFRIV